MESHIFHEFCKLMGFVKIKTGPYRPNVNGVCEQFHGALHRLIAKPVDENQ